MLMPKSQCMVLLLSRQPPRMFACEIHEALHTPGVHPTTLVVIDAVILPVQYVGTSALLGSPPQRPLASPDGSGDAAHHHHGHPQMTACPVPAAPASTTDNELIMPTSHGGARAHLRTIRTPPGPPRTCDPIFLPTLLPVLQWQYLPITPTMETRRMRRLLCIEGKASPVRPSAVGVELSLGHRIPGHLDRDS